MTARTVKATRSVLIVQKFKGFTMQHTVRYFIVDYDNEDDVMEWDLIEVTERQFIAADGEITYERHTISENGVSQICLTKGLSC